MIRKIISKQEEEKRRKKNQLIVGIVLVSIMLLSVLGYSFGTNSNQNQNQGTTLNYNGYEFIYLNGFWNVNISDNFFSFVNNPEDTYLISSEAGIKPITSYYGKPLYLYSENSDAESEIYRNLYLISQGITYACPEGENCDAGIPSKNCTNNFIIIKEKSEAKVFQEDGCVYIEGRAQDLTKIADGFLLKIMGIQKDQILK